METTLEASVPLHYFDGDDIEVTGWNIHFYVHGQQALILFSFTTLVHDYISC